MHPHIAPALNRPGLDCRSGVLWVEGNGTGVIRNRFLDLSMAVVDEPTTAEAGGVLRIEVDGPGGSASAPSSFQLGICQASVVVGMGILRVDRDGAGVIRNRLIEPPMGGVCQATVVEGRDIVWIGLNDMGEILYRLFVPLQGAIRVAAIEVCPGVGGINLDRVEYSDSASV